VGQHADRQGGGRGGEVADQPLELHVVEAGRVSDFWILDPLHRIQHDEVPARLIEGVVAAAQREAFHGERLAEERVCRGGDPGGVAQLPPPDVVIAEAGVVRRAQLGRDDPVPQRPLGEGAVLVLAEGVHDQIAAEEDEVRLGRLRMAQRLGQPGLGAALAEDVRVREVRDPEDAVARADRRRGAGGEQGRGGGAEGGAKGGAGGELAEEAAALHGIRETGVRAGVG